MHGKLVTPKIPPDYCQSGLCPPGVEHLACKKGFVSYLWQIIQLIGFAFNFLYNFNPKVEPGMFTTAYWNQSEYILEACFK